MCKMWAQAMLDTLIHNGRMTWGSGLAGSGNGGEFGFLDQTRCLVLQKLFAFWCVCNLLQQRRREYSLNCNSSGEYAVTVN
mmetsp:Transcript_14351/g.21033  ORF Transcript_14351/g.21033 Transcript_14351/m.21033 type:complete len:81 (-) Transcript_14351:160-402(-)